MTITNFIQALDIVIKIIDDRKYDRECIFKW